MFDLTRLSVAITADTKFEKQFVDNCKRYGIDPHILHKQVRCIKTDICYEIIGISKRGCFAQFVAKQINSNKNYEYMLDIRKVMNPTLYQFL